MSILNAITAGAGGVALTGDTSGNLTIQSAGTNVVTFTSTGMITNTGAPAFSAYANANQNLTSNSWTKVQINTKQFDTNSNFDATTNYRFTPTVAGYYQINGSIEYNSSGNNPTVVGIRIYKNGNPFFGDFITGSVNSGQTTSISCLISFNGSTDYIELYAFANGGSGTLYVQTSTTGNSIPTYFSGCLVRSA